MNGTGERTAWRWLIIMPAYNEAQNIGAVLEEIRRVDENRQGVMGSADILVVDDASRDDTGRRARSQGAIVVRHPCNLGYGGAVQTGFRYAVEQGYDYAVLMDSDGQHDAHDIPRLLEVVASGGADVALGSRFLGRMEYRADWLRQLGVWVFRRVASLTLGRRITDPTSGFQALNGDVLRFFAWDNYPTDYPDTDVLLSLHLAGFRVQEVPVTMRERYSGTSMHTNWKAAYYVAKMFLSILVVLLRAWTRSNPRRLARPEAVRVGDTLQSADYHRQSVDDTPCRVSSTRQGADCRQSVDDTLQSADCRQSVGDTLQSADCRQSVGDTRQSGAEGGSRG